MDNEYDVFEILPDGSAIWRAFVRGTHNAFEVLKAVGKQTCNECFATDLSRQTIIGRVNSGRSAEHATANEERATGS